MLIPLHPVKTKTTSLCHDVVNRYLGGEGAIVKIFWLDIIHFILEQYFGTFKRFTNISPKHFMISESEKSRALLEEHLPCQGI